MVRRGWLAFFSVLISFSALASEIPKEEMSSLYTGAWKMPSQIPVDRLESLIGQISNSIYGKGYRYLGVEEDFFHGHLLLENRGTVEEKRFFPRAILYHTQEDAYGAYWRGDRDKKYTYLNVAARNWLQWLSDDRPADGLLIENARAYVDVTKREPSQFYTEFAEPNAKTHYTMHSHELDPKKLGFAPAAQLQFEFYLMGCGETLVNNYGNIKGPIQVRLPNDELVCMKVTTANMLDVFTPERSSLSETGDPGRFAKRDTWRIESLQ